MPLGLVMLMGRIHLRVWVRGCTWSSVVVDVPTDVRGEVFRSQGSDGSLPCCETSDSWVSCFSTDRATDLQILHVEVRMASRRPDAVRPHGSPGQPSTERVCAPCSSAPRLSCGSPGGGRRDATPCSSTQSRLLCRLSETRDIPNWCPVGAWSTLCVTLEVLIARRLPLWPRG